MSTPSGKCTATRSFRVCRGTGGVFILRLDRLTLLADATVTGLFIDGLGHGTYRWLGRVFVGTSNHLVRR